MSDAVEPPNRSPYRVFISYSHEDAGFVQPIVKLLRTGEEPTFLDTDSLRTGERWREQLNEALRDIRQLIVFWCFHSSRSVEVSREYEAAIDAQKKVVPVLLDSTPLPARLGAFQGIDLRRLGRREHSWLGRLIAPSFQYVLALLFFVGSAVACFIASQVISAPPPAINNLEGSSVLVGFFVFLGLVTAASIGILVALSRFSRALSRTAQHVITLLFFIGGAGSWFIALQVVSGSRFSSPVADVVVLVLIPAAFIGFIVAALRLGQALSKAVVKRMQHRWTTIRQRRAARALIREWRSRMVAGE